IVKMLIVVVTLFALCWMPLHVFNADLKTCPEAEVLRGSGRQLQVPVTQIVGQTNGGWQRHNVRNQSRSIMDLSRAIFVVSGLLNFGSTALNGAASRKNQLHCINAAFCAVPCPEHDRRRTGFARLWVDVDATPELQPKAGLHPRKGHLLRCVWVARPMGRVICAARASSTYELAATTHRFMGPTYTANSWTDWPAAIATEASEPRP
uniref:G_PROTEIN_RECEP_F1_2 domain-containing protein n=1 Tax=Macrostomum lignano TaxID=282301 RepID=A0A1I8FIB0_9PLAT